MAHRSSTQPSMRLFNDSPLPFLNGRHSVQRRGSLGWKGEAAVVVYRGEGEVYREREPHPLPLLLLLRGLFPVVHNPSPY